MESDAAHVRSRKSDRHHDLPDVAGRYAGGRFLGTCQAFQVSRRHLGHAHVFFLPRCFAWWLKPQVQNPLLVLLCIIVQNLALVWYCASYIPYVVLGGACLRMRATDITSG